MTLETYFLTVCTLGTNKNLTSCLEMLTKLKLSSALDLEILVVVNSAELNLQPGPNVRVIFEPERGYSNVRNSALDYVRGKGHLIFLDDDEIPTIEWLEALVSTHQLFPSDVIFGPVLPQWGSTSGSFRSYSVTKYQFLSEHQVCEHAGSGNLLIPASVLEKECTYFDPIFNISGSEDTDLTFRLTKNGVKIRYSSQALLLENENEERFTKDYVTNRFTKDVANYSLVIRRNGSGTQIFWRFTTLLARIIAYGLSPSNPNRAINIKTYWLSLRSLLTGKPYLTR